MIIRPVRVYHKGHYKGRYNVRVWGGRVYDCTVEVCGLLFEESNLSYGTRDL